MGEYLVSFVKKIVWIGFCFLLFNVPALFGLEYGILGNLVAGAGAIGLGLILDRKLDISLNLFKKEE